MKKLTCIVCPRGCDITIEENEEGYNIKGNQCNKGKEYAINEITNPKRSVTTTVKTIYKKFPRLPVRTDREIELKYVFSVMKILNSTLVDRPLRCGEIVIADILGTGVSIISTCDMYEVLEGENYD